MLRAISWPQFTVFIVFLLAGYYTFLAWVLYRPALQQFIQNIRNLAKSPAAATQAPKPQSPTQNPTPPANTPPTETANANNPTPPSKATQTILQSIEEIVTEARETGHPLQTIQEQIHRVLRAHPDLQGADQEAIINQNIKQQCLTSFTIDLTSADIQRLWDGKFHQTPQKTEDI